MEKSDKKDKDAKHLVELQRHLDMTEKFEQHFPHFEYVAGRSIIYSDSSAQIESVEAKQAPYEQLVGQVKIYADSPPVPMKIKNFKYLGRVYSVSLDKLSDLSEEFEECLKEKNGTVLVAQIVTSQAKTQSLRFSSHYPMQFYALGHDEFEERLTLTGPIRFKNFIPEHSAISEDGKLLEQDQFDPLTDLLPFDNSSTNDLAYKP